MINGVMPNLENVIKYVLPITETVLPTIINKVVNGNTHNNEPSYIPPQDTPVVCNKPMVNTEVDVVTDNSVIPNNNPKVQINLNMNVFVLHSQDDFDKLKDMSFSKSYEI